MIIEKLPPNGNSGTVPPWLTPPSEVPDWIDVMESLNAVIRDMQKNQNLIEGVSEN